MKGRPTTLQQLSACCGLGEDRTAKLGASIVRLVKAATTTTTTTSMDLDDGNGHSNKCDGGDNDDNKMDLDVGNEQDNNEGGNVEECTDGGQGNNCSGGQCDEDGGECFGIDDKVEGRWKKNGKWYSGTITGMKNKKGKTSYDVTFDSDGSWYVGLALLCNQYNDAKLTFFFSDFFPSFLLPFFFLSSSSSCIFGRGSCDAVRSVTVNDVGTSSLPNLNVSNGGQEEGEQEEGEGEIKILDPATTTTTTNQSPPPPPPPTTTMDLEIPVGQGEYNGNSSHGTLMKQDSGGTSMDLDDGNGHGITSKCDGECDVEEEEQQHWEVGEEVDGFWRKKWYKCVIQEVRLKKNEYHYVLKFEVDGLT